MRSLQSQDPNSATNDPNSGKPEPPTRVVAGDDYDGLYDDIQPASQQQATPGRNFDAIAADAQDNYFESREPAELIFCIILAAAFIGLAEFCWQPLQANGDWLRFIAVEGFFITPALLAIVLGFRPYVSPSSLQIGRHGIKYRGPYWPQRRTVNWDQIYRLYLSPELILIAYRPTEKPSSSSFLFIQSNYLADRKGIVDSFAKYALVKPVYLKNPDWYIKAVLLGGYVAIVCWILYMLRG